MAIIKTMAIRPSQKDFFMNRSESTSPANVNANPGSAIVRRSKLEDGSRKIVIDNLLETRLMGFVRRHWAMVSRKYF